MNKRLYNLSLAISFLRHFLFSRRSGALIKIISWLCMLGIGTGIFALIVVMSVMNGFNTSIRDRMLSVEPHLVIHLNSVKGDADMRAEGWLEKNNYVFGHTETQDVILRTQSGFVQGAIAQGVSQKTLNQIVEGNRRQKHLITREATDYKLDTGEVLVGGGLGDTMGLFEGDPLVVIAPESLLGGRGALPVFEMVKVKDFLRTDIDTLDAHTFFYVKNKALSRLQRTSSMERFIEVRLPNPEEFSVQKSYLESLGLKVDSWIDRNSNLFFSLKVEKFVVGILLGLSTLIASFSLVTLMIILVTQKKKDIGVLMAMGFDSVSITSIFQFIGMAVACIGIFGGVLIGVPFSFFLKYFSHGILPSIYAETNLPAEVHFSQVVMIIMISVIFANLVSWLAVRRLTGLTPVEALRGI
jgi:lipoprotein-releasing system permease protein